NEPNHPSLIASSFVFEVQDKNKDLSRHGSEKSLIVGAVLGSVSLVVIIVLAAYLIFFRSRRRRSIRDGVIRNSLTRPNPFLNYITTKCNPRPKPVRLDDNTLGSSLSGGIVQRGSLHTIVEESMPHEGTVAPSQPLAICNGSTGQIQRLRARIQQLILDRETARSPDNEEDSPPAYEEVTDNVSRVETSTS
ncbi:hypothetical protein EDD18DRAFT_1193939, partial [Armillaria luteobubalina]